MKQRFTTIHKWILLGIVLLGYYSFTWTGLNDFHITPSGAVRARSEGTIVASGAGADQRGYLARSHGEYRIYIVERKGRSWKVTAAEHYPEDCHRIPSQMCMPNGQMAIAGAAVATPSVDGKGDFAVFAGEIHDPRIAKVVADGMEQDVSGKDYYFFEFTKRGTDHVFAQAKAGDSTTLYIYNWSWDKP